MLTYLLAVLASGANATASVLQRKANRELPGNQQMSPRLVVKLLSNPVWLGGLLGVTTGFLLQAGALAVGQLSVVEPILVCELPLTLMLASQVFRAPLHRREWAAALGMTVGLASVLYFLAPSSPTRYSVDPYVWLVAAGATGCLVAAAAWFGRRAGEVPGGGRAPAGFGVAAGCQFGLTAALMKGAMSRSAQGFVEIFTSWQLYAMVASGLLGMYLLQAAMRAGPLLAAQPGLTLSDPLVSILWGVLVFHERIRGGWYLALALCGGALIALSVLVLSRSPLLVDDDAPQPDRQGG